MATDVQERTSWLNRLLRGELAAVETYEQAVSQCNGKSCSVDLKLMANEHREAAATLRRHVVEHGGEPSASSGPWGAWAQFVTGTAQVFGTAATFRALKQGEDHGRADYEAALEDEDLDPECKVLIRTTLLPRQYAHLRTLDALIESNQE
jgi:uncharacterized protein (TIGR02284 family)